MRMLFVISSGFLGIFLKIFLNFFTNKVFVALTVGTCSQKVEGLNFVQGHD